MRVQIRTFYCLECGKENKTTDIMKKFCSHHCSAKYSNKHRKYNPSNDKRTKKAFCKICHKELIVHIRTNIDNVVCKSCKNIKKRKLYREKHPIVKRKISNNNRKKRVNIICKHCQKNFEGYGDRKYCSTECFIQEKRKEKMELVVNGLYKYAHPTSYARWFKRYLIQTRGHKCEICGNTEWMNKKIPLILDHINGHAYDNNLKNLRLVCGNCDMQLPTYKSKNKNSDRKYRTDYTKQMARLTPVGAGTALEKQRA